jgi:hypothetical protein
MDRWRGISNEGSQSNPVYGQKVAAKWGNNNAWKNWIEELQGKPEDQTWNEYLTWRKNRKLRLSGARPPIWVLETKANPCVGLRGEFLLSILNVYFKDESKPWPSCLLIELEAIRDGSVKVRHARLYTKSWFRVENNPRESPSDRSLKEENLRQSWDCRNNRAVTGVTSPLNLGKNTPALTSALRSQSHARAPSQRSP